MQLHLMQTINASPVGNIKGTGVSQGAPVTPLLITKRQTYESAYAVAAKKAAILRCIIQDI